MISIKACKHELLETKRKKSIELHPKICSMKYKQRSDLKLNQFGKQILMLFSKDKDAYKNKTNLE